MKVSLIYCGLSCAALAGCAATTSPATFERTSVETNALGAEHLIVYGTRQKRTTEVAQIKELRGVIDEFWTHVRESNFFGQPSGRALIPYIRNTLEQLLVVGVRLGKEKVASLNVTHPDFDRLVYLNRLGDPATALDAWANAAFVYLRDFAHSDDVGPIDPETFAVRLNTDASFSHTVAATLTIHVQDVLRSFILELDKADVLTGDDLPHLGQVSLRGALHGAVDAYIARESIGKAALRWPDVFTGTTTPYGAIDDARAARVIRAGLRRGLDVRVDRTSRFIKVVGLADRR